MNGAEAREWPDSAWRQALEAGDAEPEPEIDRLADSRVVSVRYALGTGDEIASPERRNRAAGPNVRTIDVLRSVLPGFRPAEGGVEGSIRSGDP